MNDEHKVTVLPERSYLNGSTWYRAHCSCGKYRSGLHAFSGKAAAAGRDHAKAKRDCR